MGCCDCKNECLAFVAQIVELVVSIVAIAFAYFTGRQQNKESVRENKISLLKRRMEYLDLLKVLLKCLTIARSCAMRNSGDSTFSPYEFASQVEQFLRVNPLLLHILKGDGVDFNAKAKAFFTESARCLSSKLAEGEYIFRAEKIHDAAKSASLVFELSSNWSTDEGVIYDPPSECELYTSLSKAMENIISGVEAGKEEMKIV